jgi:hypothetical protein
LRWVTSPIAAQTIDAQSVWVSIAGSVSNTNSGFYAGYPVVGLWRPGSGTLVGLLVDDPVTQVTNFSSTSELADTINTTSTSIVALDGDILVVELWRSAGPQSMSTSYTNTFFYDGTVEDSATDNAAYLGFTNTITMSGGGPPVVTPPLLLPPPLQVRMLR